jgi:hypothetical protein
MIFTQEQLIENTLLCFKKGSIIIGSTITSQINYI